MGAPVLTIIDQGGATGDYNTPELEAGEAILILGAIAHWPESITTPSGGYTVQESTSGGSWSRLYWFYRIASGHEDASTVTINKSGGSIAIAVFKVTGLKTGTLSDFQIGTANNSGTPTEMDPPAIAPSWGATDETLFVAATALRIAFSCKVISWPDNMPDNNIQQLYGADNSPEPSNPDYGLGVASVRIASANFDPDSFTVDNQDNHSTRALAIRGTEPTVVPEIDDIQPRNFKNDDLVEITGSNFKASQGNGKVELGDNREYALANKKEQIIDHWEDIAIRFIVDRGELPNGAVFVFVTNDDDETSPDPPEPGEDPTYPETELEPEIGSIGRGHGTSVELRLERIYAAIAGHTVPRIGRDVNFLMKRIGLERSINITSGYRSFEDNLMILYRDLTGNAWTGPRSTELILSAIESEL